MIALFGGSFDPIHLGHVHLAKQIVSLYSCEHFFFVPARLNPHKLDEPPVSSDDRLEMIRITLETEKDPRLGCLDWELRRPGPSFTVLTLEQLPESARPVSLVMGNDVFRSLTRWHRPSSVLRLANIIVIIRNIKDSVPVGEILAELGITDAHPESAQKWQHSDGRRWIELKEIAALPYSATEIRAEIRKAWASCSASETPTSLPRGITQEVWEFIKKKRLYAVNT